MTVDALRVTGTAIVWAETGGDYLLNMSEVLTNEARQGQKGDLTATFASEYSVEFVVDTGPVAPSIGEAYELYWGSSNSSVSGTDNSAGLNGIDSDYTGIGSATVDESKSQLEYIGSLHVVDEVNTVQREYFSLFPKSRYNIPIFINKTSQTTGADSSMKVKLVPIIDQAQNEV